MDIVAFLQNAWFKPGTNPKYIDKYQSDHEYRRRVLAMSTTGKRLYSYFGEPFFRSVRWENSTTQTGETSDSRFPPDPQHILTQLTAHNPKIVVTFGGNAEHVVTSVWANHLLVLPHPAYRFATKGLFQDAHKIIQQIISGEITSLTRLALRQKKGYVEQVALKPAWQ